MNIEENKDLSGLTTFHLPAKARWYAEYSSESELLRLSRTEQFLNNEVLYIGGGSNLLFINDFNGLVLKSCIDGIVRYEKNDDTVFIIAGAGVVWNDFVEWCIDHDLAGTENMAGIPGSVGASAVQNIGAYGAEAKDIIFAVECFDTLTRTTRRFSNEECRFGYRDSFFKHEGKDRYVVLRVSYRLKKSNIAENLEYGSLRNLKEQLGHAPTIREVATEICRIRNEKLPSPDVTGSAGSFFKNPVISIWHYKELTAELNIEIPYHKVDEHYVKISAAWLIDNAGMKGVTCGGAAVWKKQPLVLVNQNKATGKDVERLAEMVKSAVRKKFRINLQPEVNYIDTSITVTILGSGTSKGIPEVGCECRVCKSGQPRDKRLRASALVKTHGLNILIDPSPDFREQALRHNIHDIVAVLITHSHYDHVGGIDDLRPFCASRNLPMYVRKDVDSDLRKRLDYCFIEHPYPGVPTFDMRIIDNYPFYFNGLKIEPIEVYHGKKPIYGYRIGSFAYVTDAKTISDVEIDKLLNLDVLIINALRDREHFAHLTIPEALALIEKVRPRRAYLTHFCHEAGLHEEIEKRTPDHVHPAYDGLTIEIS